MEPISHRPKPSLTPGSAVTSNTEVMFPSEPRIHRAVSLPIGSGPSIDLAPPHQFRLIAAAKVVEAQAYDCSKHFAVKRTPVLGQPGHQLVSARIGHICRGGGPACKVCRHEPTSYARHEDPPTCSVTRHDAHLKLAPSGRRSMVLRSR